MNRSNNNAYTEQRRGPDLWAKTASGLAGGGWLLIFATLVLAGLAKPEQQSMYDDMHNIRLRTTWDMQLAGYMFVTVCGAFASSAGSIIISLLRYRRESDSFPIFSFIGVLGSAGGIIACLTYF
ncbi:MAG: hypothetical protein GY868_08360 [Deltaproteobacteria bacterium]|nr:hypothetical protein [Deltaproteobacteria bacterium]